MSTPELNAKGLRAYALYFLAHFAQLFFPTLLLQLVTGSSMVGQLGMALVWGWALFRLTTRFFRGQGRAVSRAEGRYLAIVAALYCAILVTAVRGTLTVALGLPTPPEVPFSALLAVEFIVAALVNTLTLGVYLLPFIQDRAFAAWRERNP